MPGSGSVKRAARAKAPVPVEVASASSVRALPPPRPTARRLLVAGIGASAGGLQSLQELFSHVKPEAAVAYVVVTHQHPGHHSLLPDLLAKMGSLPVQEAADGDVLEPGHVYVAPPRASLTLRGGTLHVAPPQDDTPGHHVIDAFFRSLAEDVKERAIAVVLSGTGSDGTLGLAAIKGEGGITMAEDLRSASYPGMPESAIQSGSVDQALPAAELAHQIGAHADGGVAPFDGAAALKDEKKLLGLLRARTGHDFTHYKKNTVRRRIERRMSLHRVHDLSTYLRFLQDNPGEIDAMYREMLIGVTSFFRDPPTMTALAVHIAKLVATCPDTSSLRVWVPACSTGEEAYSIAILAREAMEQAKKRVSVRIFATDVDAEAIEVARKGVYLASIAEDAGAERLQRYFANEEGMYRVVKDVRDMIVFAPQNVLADPPFTRLDLLSCRNLLIYLAVELQEHLMALFHYALRPGGLLFLGASESIVGHDELFSVADKKAKIYVRKGTSGRAGLAPRSSPLPPGRKAEAPAGIAPRPSPLPALASALLLKTYVPPSVLVNERGEVVYIHGSTGNFLEPAAGQPSFNLVQMARDGLKVDLDAILRQAVAHADHTVTRPARVREGAGYRRVQLTARSIHDPESLRGLVLITFQPQEGPAAKEKSTKGRRGASTARGVIFSSRPGQQGIQGPCWASGA